MTQFELEQGLNALRKDLFAADIICTGTEKLFMRKSYKNYQIMD